ncbi:hypothetical protein BH23ACI1_BH23ACI1_18450 [soil metagenome]
MADSALSRRLSEFIGVTLFAWSLLWLVALASHSAADPVWFFNTGSGGPPANLAGRLGAFMAELSSQLVGYAAYLIPVVMAVIGWHYFWCRVLDAAYTKLIGAGLLFCCTSAFLSLVVVNEPEARAFRAGGYLGDFLAGSLADYLNKTGSFILILTLLFLAVILSTQFSFGRLFQAIGEMILNRWAAFRAGVRERREERRREKQRQEVLKKHLEKAGKEAKPQEALAGVSQLESRESPVTRPTVAQKHQEAEPNPAGTRPP